jgi:hypothetical protein
MDATLSERREKEARDNLQLIDLRIEVAQGKRNLQTGLQCKRRKEMAWWRRFLHDRGWRRDKRLNEPSAGIERIDSELARLGGERVPFAHSRLCGTGSDTSLI